jgi:hypothetical protein
MLTSEMWLGSMSYINKETLDRNEYIRIDLMDTERQQLMDLCHLCAKYFKMTFRHLNLPVNKPV